MSVEGDTKLGRRATGRPVSRSILIDRPAHEVAQQFGDVDHHERTDLHTGTRFHVLEQDDDFCEYEQHSRVGLIKIRQQFHLDRSDRFHQVNTVTGGNLNGGTLVFDIVESGPGSAEVTATLTPPNTFLIRVAGPILRRAIDRSLAAALEEDRADLESGRYAAG